MRRLFEDTRQLLRAEPVLRFLLWLALISAVLLCPPMLLAVFG
ncbi:MAG: hypothetical protein RR426_08910 [Oscillospiraceae bacterium]